MSRRSTRRSASPRPPEDDGDDDDAREQQPARRVSSRATKFSSSMKEPTEANIPSAVAPSPAKTRGRGKKRASESDSSAEEEESSDSEEEEEEGTRRRSSRTTTRRSATRTQPARGGGGTTSKSRAARKPPSSPKCPKSPAIRHKTKRRMVKTEIPVIDTSDDESESEEEESDEEGGSGGEEEEEEEEMRVQRVIACRSEPRRVWRQMCDSMNTSEIDNGSRWFQDDREDADGDVEMADADGAAGGGGGGGAGGGGDIFEERFLVKWADLSYLHCSWELEDDLLTQVDNAKSYLTTFFRKSDNGLLFDADERGDGEYYDPSYVQIERVLEIIEPELEDEDEEDEDMEEADDNAGTTTSSKGGKSLSSATTSSAASSPLLEKYGIILDKDHPDYESGTGRQFLIKWGNSPYSDSTYEFERDLILNDIDYEDHVGAFLKRSKKPTRAEMKAAFGRQEEQTRRLYKIFGDKAKLSDEERDDKIGEYQKKLEEHVFCNGGQVRDYQAEGISWLLSNYVNRRSSILADEMGLGKTIQTAVYVNLIVTELAKRGPFLIVAPLSTIPHWYREFSGWTDLNIIVYHGSAKDREYIREFEMAFETDRPTNLGFNQQFLRRCHKRNALKWERTWMTDVIITTPEMLVTDDFAELTAVRWELLVVDEAHRLKNHASKLASNLRDDRFQFNGTLLLTGTPIQNNMNEMWTLLNIVDPKKFGDVDEFLDRYGDIKSKDRVDELHENIRPYILRRLKEDVEKSVPPKEETLIEVELTVLQKQYYRALYEKNVQFLHRNQKKALDGPSINNLAMQLRKCCNHPFLLNGVEDEVRAQEGRQRSEDADKEADLEGDFLVRASGKLVLLDKLLPKLREGGHRVLIFSQFKIMLDIIEDYLALRGMKHERIDGSITGKKRQMAIDRFQAEEADGKESAFIMLLSTRAGGVGINLTAADTCIIFDSDWNPQNDLQAQARCHRIGQTKSVKVYRLLSRKTYEMQMFHQSSLKMGLDQAVLQGIEGGGSGSGEGVLTKEEVERLLRHGAYDIFNEEKTGSSEKESTEFESQDIDSIMARRAKTVIHENTGSKSSAAGGTFSKASFKAKKDESEGAISADTEDVDIDDPDFWKKMVGEARIEDENANLQGKKRKRKEANYSEADYDKNLKATLKAGDDDSDSDSETSVSSAESDSDASDGEEDFEFGQTKLTNELLQKMKDEKKSSTQKQERTRWGGKGPKDWTKANLELLLNSLQASGYGNVPWDEMLDKMDFERADSYSIEEMRRMSWALVLFGLRESVDEDVRDVARRAERAAEKKEKKRESEEGKPPPAEDGGVLGKAAVPSDADNTEKESQTDQSQTAQIDQSFQKLWSANATWATKALEDAVAYAKAHTPRAKSVIEEVRDEHSHGEHKVPKKPLPPLTVAFNENVLPALRSRGWKEETVADKKKAKHWASPPKRYIYDGRTYKTVASVLEAAPKAHPELANTVESIISSVAKEAAAGDAEGSEEAAKVKDEICSIDAKNVTAQSLAALLESYAPLQLLYDRTKESKVKIGRRFLLILTYLNAAHALVIRADAKQASDAEAGGTSEYEKVSRLAKLIIVDKRTALPHSSWNSRHDAILVRAIAKHGWIDRESTCRAITEDDTIKWGAPFDDGDKDASSEDAAAEERKEEAPKSQAEVEPEKRPSEDTSADEKKEDDPEPEPKAEPKEEKADKGASDVSELKAVAERAAAFFNSEKAIVDELKGFNKDLVIRTFGLVKQVQEEKEGDDDEFERPPAILWNVDESLLQLCPSSDSKDSACETKDGSVAPDEMSDLPSRKELLRRAKIVLGRSSKDSPAPDAASDAPAASQQDGADKSHDFCVLDQSYRCNILLAELLRSVPKLAINKGNGQRLCKKLLGYAFKEVDQLQAAAAKAAGLGLAAACADPTSSQAADMNKIHGHLDLVKRTIAKHQRQGKNVVRAILGIDPVQPKNPSDGLFPVALPKFGSLPLTAAKKEKKKSSAPKKAKKEEPENTKKETKKDPKKPLQEESAAGDVAINRALALVMDNKDKGGKAQAGEGDGSDKFVKLTSIETLILSVISSQGLPVFDSENWQALLDPDCSLEDEERPGDRFAINWYLMAGVVQKAAGVWEDIARRHYESKMNALKRNEANLSEEEIREQRDACRLLKDDLSRKESATAEAEELNDNPYQLAKKSIMMLESLRKKMGPIESSKGKSTKKKSLNRVGGGLGPKVLQWCSKELGKWAVALRIADEKNRPHAAVSYDYLDDSPELEVSACFDKRACRAVFAQCAQQARLRSIFIAHDMDKMGNELVPQAIKNSQSSDDVWDACPEWWCCDLDNPASLTIQDDMDLLTGILDFGYSGYDGLIRQSESFRERIEKEKQMSKITDDSCKAPPNKGVNNKAQQPPQTVFTRASIQQRANHITRELHALEEAADVMRLMAQHAKLPKNESTAAGSKRSGGGTVQTGIDNYFGAKKETSKVTSSRISSSDIESDDRVVEVVDAPKRKSEGGNSGSAEKRRKK